MMEDAEERRAKQCAMLTERARFQKEPRIATLAAACYGGRTDPEVFDELLDIVIERGSGQEMIDFAKVAARDYGMHSPNLEKAICERGSCEQIVQYIEFALGFEYIRSAVGFGALVWAIIRRGTGNDAAWLISLMVGHHDIAEKEFMDGLEKVVIERGTAADAILVARLDGMGARWTEEQIRRLQKVVLARGSGAEAVEYALTCPTPFYPELEEVIIERGTAWDAYVYVKNHTVFCFLEGLVDVIEKRGPDRPPETMMQSLMLT